MPAPGLPHPADETQLMADRAYLELRDRIVTLGIAPGAPIDEEELGAGLAMGRTPVREAIKRLAHDRLVTVFPRRGTFASEVNISDLAHISTVRVALEGLAASLAAARITPAQHRELAGLLEELGRLDAGDPDRDLMALDGSIHGFIYRCAANPFLEESLVRYFYLSLRIWHLVLDRLAHLAADVRTHAALLQAIDAGDAEAARAHAAAHVLDFEREIRGVL